MSYLGGREGRDDVVRPLDDGLVCFIGHLNRSCLLALRRTGPREITFEDPVRWSGTGQSSVSLNVNDGVRDVAKSASTCPMRSL